MVTFNRKQQPFKHYKGFNLIEILLAITFFSLAFSGMLLGSTAMINTSTSGTKINEDNAISGAMFTGINAQSAYVEASATQLTTAIATANSITNNPAGDTATATRQVVIIPDNTAATTDNRRFFFDRLVYSNLNTPDIKTVQINMYNQLTGGVPTKSIIRKIDKREECFAMGVDDALFLPSLGQPCTGWSSGVNVPRYRALPFPLTGAGGVQDFERDFRINGATPALVTTNTFGLFEQTVAAMPVNPTDKGHRVANGTVAEYWIEATPNVAYDLYIGLRKQTNAQTYTVSVNGAYSAPGEAINCEMTIDPVTSVVTPIPRNCQRKTITQATSALTQADGEPFTVAFKHIMPYSLSNNTDGNRRVFRITVVSTVPPLSTAPVINANPAVIHFIKKELAKN